jgi:ribosomal protein S8
MNFFKKMILLTILFSFIGCSKNAYVRTIEKGYSKSREDSTIYIKDSEGFIYTKKKIKYSRYENQHFLVLKKDKKTQEKTLYLGLKYRGDRWLYINELDLISEDTYHINFMARKLNTAFWRDRSNLRNSMEEYIAFALKTQEIDALKKMVDSNHGKIKYYSEIHGRSVTTTITPEEIQNMSKILELYSK